MLYELGGAWYVDIDAKSMPMECLTVEWSLANGARTLRVLTNGSLVAEVVYKLLPHEPTRPENPTACAEEEEFDLGLLIANMSRDKERQRQVLSG